MGDLYDCDACKRPCSKTFETLVKVNKDWLAMEFCRECFTKIGYKSPTEYRDELIARSRRDEEAHRAEELREAHNGLSSEEDK